MGDKVLIIGGGGREYALGWRISQDSNVEKVYFAPGNAGTALDTKCQNIPIDGAKKVNFEEIYKEIKDKKIDVVVVGPEQPLVDGIVDFFNKKGFTNIFGPTAKASKIEEDKFYSYDIMKAADIPQAESIKCYTEDGARRAIDDMHKLGDKVVIKARGLTGGKGVYVTDGKEDAYAKLEKHAKEYKKGGVYEVLISERLYGEEFSVFGISDGKIVIPIEMSIQDHKTLLDGGKGPNTGGMGAFGPALNVADAESVREVTDNMMTPTVQEMGRYGTEYKGFLYGAAIKTEDDVKFLEYNCRFGDPEAQPTAMIMENMYESIIASLEGKLNKINFRFNPGAACCIVMASKGYPDSKSEEYAIVQGLPIGGLEEVAEMENVKVFHAGTILKDGKIIINGGRVLGVTAYSPKGIAHAKELAYIAVKRIDLETRILNNKEVLIYRKDIADKALR